MAKEWYIRVRQNEIGPMSSLLLKQHADAELITPETPIKLGSTGEWVSASRVKNLFTNLDTNAHVDTDRAQAELSPASSSESLLAEEIRSLTESLNVGIAADAGTSTETVTHYLQTILEACRDEDEDRLRANGPPLHAIHPFSISHVLLDYEIKRVTPLSVPPMDELTPPEKRTKPVRQMLEAEVMVTLCDRPSYPITLQRLRELQPGRHEVVVIYECKEFKDGEWLFLDATLTR